MNIDSSFIRQTLYYLIYQIVYGFIADTINKWMEMKYELWSHLANTNSL